MEGFGASNMESRSNIKIEHLPWIDVVCNLDYSTPSDIARVIELIKEKGAPTGGLAFLQDPFDTDADNKKFFLAKKAKSTSQRLVDFSLGRSQDDPISKELAGDFDKESRYALAGILNEIVLSPKIKRLVSSLPFQNIARDYGFAGFDFVEPIAGLVEKSPQGYYKYLVYPNKKNIEFPISVNNFRKIIKVCEKLRKLFLENGIHPHDLRESQFIVTQDGLGSYLHLVDIEAYTEERKK